MTRCLLAGLCLGLVAQLALLDLAASQRGRDLAAAPDGLDQILGDGQPEDIGYGFQRARTASRNTRDAPQPEGLLLVDRAAPGLKQRGAAADDGDEHVTSAFRERLAARQRRQRAQLQQQRERELDDILERYMQAVFEASRKLSQQQTGAIDVGPDDLTDMETLQFLESLGEDIPGARKRSGSGAGAGPARQYASGAPSPWDWAAPLAWSGYQLRKRSTSPDFQDDSSSEWSDDGAADDDEGVVPGSRLAMLLSQQLFDERYNDPAVKRLLLSKRSLSAQAAPPRRQDAEEDPEQGLQGLEGRAMRRRKKSTRSEPSVPAELVRILGESKPDGELEPPLALPLAAEPSPAPSNATAAPAPMNPIGHAHETDKLAREHSAHAHPAEPAASTVSPNVVVKVHVEHAPPMVSAEGPHSHDSATHAEDKKTPAHVEKLAGSPAGAAAGPSGLVSEAEAAPRDEPLALPRRSRRLAKKSIDWSQYFGIDRRRKKSLSVNDVDANDLDADWLLRHNLMALSKNSKPSNINKRVAIKREGASPDALLLGAWGARQGWDDDDDGDGDDVVQAGRCPAVTRLAESCRAAIGSNDGLLPLCVLYQACHLCGAAMGVPVGSSCETELGRRGADLCATTPTPAREEECRSAVESIVQVYRSSRHGTPDTETCASQPCLAHFFLSAPAVAFAR